uniref:SGNH hydrolase-type esterase domain-containing protein n=1 Tax=Hippocampus comes TaxID=109280 RepID=A0A3Q2XB11_HIPCM
YRQPSRYLCAPDFPPLAGVPTTSSPSTTQSKMNPSPRIPSENSVHPFSIAHRCSIPQFTPAPQRTVPGLLPCTSPSTSPPLTEPAPRSTLPSPTPACPLRPLFPPTTLIVGDSITRNLRFFNTTTHCFPGATVPIILAKLPSLLHPLPPSVHRIIVHVGCVDASHRQSEITKSDFNKLLQFLNSTGKSIFISGPLSPHRGMGIFSRILSLHTWLQTACRTHNVGFIDNFNIFWRRPSVLKADGFHPKKLGNRILAANVQHAVHHSTS